MKSAQTAESGSDDRARTASFFLVSGQRSARQLGALALCVFVAASGPARADDPPGAPDSTSRFDSQKLDSEIQAILNQHGRPIRAGIWLGSPTGEVWYERNAETVLPTASAVKAFYLVELYDRFRDRLDEPLPGVHEIVSDDSHPAVSHFATRSKEEIRERLDGATVRRIGEIMIGQSDVSNAVYNAAANVVTAALGGPEALTRAIHARDPAFHSVACRRYMLRDRTQPGDNEAAPAAFAALYQKLAAESLAGLDADTRAAIRQTLHWPKKQPGRLFAKGGSLGSEPLTRVRAGWWETDGGPFVFVIMTAQAIADEAPASEQSEALLATIDRLEQLVSAAGRAQRGASPAARDAASLSE